MATESKSSQWTPVMDHELQSDFSGAHSSLPASLRMLEEHVGLIQSESMDLQNDPRFFQGNVLNKRLSAFSGLSVVSGLMVGTCSAVISMKKDVNFVSFEGTMQLASFSLMSIVLFLNVMATYVSVAQIYHTYRLETAGPTGFEMATSYYLNPNIVAWRHLAVKCMLNSLPIFLISTGIRISVNFERLVHEPEMPTAFTARFLSLTFLGSYFLAGCVVYYVHQKHMAIFRENYETVKGQELPYLKHVQTLMSSRRRAGHAPDV